MRINGGLEQCSCTCYKCRAGQRSILRANKEPAQVLTRGGARPYTYRLRMPYVTAAKSTIQPMELPRTTYSSSDSPAHVAAVKLLHVKRSAVAGLRVIAAARARATGGVCITRRHVMYGVEPYAKFA